MSESNQHYRTNFIISEQTQVACVFASKPQAVHAIEQLVRGTDVEPQQVTLIEPGDSEFNQILEGDSKAIGRMMWFSHLLLGAAGFAVGLIAAYLLVNIGPAFTRQHPLASYIIFILAGVFIGLVFALLLSMRPDRTQITEVIRKALKERRYTVVVNLRSDQSVIQVRELFNRFSGNVVVAIE